MKLYNKYLKLIKKKCSNNGNNDNLSSFLATISYIYMFLFSKLPGRKGTGPGGWMIQAKLQVYFWLGSIKHKKSYPSGLPPGFQVTNELLNAERPGLPPPISIHYAEKHVRIIFLAIRRQPRYCLNLIFY